jgi:hypothetical protein
MPFRHQPLQFAAGVGMIGDHLLRELLFVGRRLTERAHLSGKNAIYRLTANCFCRSFTKVIIGNLRTR